MSKIFPKWSNRLPLLIVIFVFVLAGTVTAGITYYFTPKYARVGYQPDQPDGASDGFSFPVEGGLEWNFDAALVLVGKAQYRLYDRGGHNHSGWSLHLGFGLPFPF